MTRYRATSSGGLNALAEEVAGTGEGNRNHVLYWATLRAAEEDFEAADIAETLTEAALGAGLSQQETKQTIRSAFNYATKASLWGAGVGRSTETPSEAALEAFVRASYPDWPADWPTDDEHWRMYYTLHPEWTNTEDGAPEIVTGETTLADFWKEELPEPEWLVRRYVPKGGVGGLLGQFKAGKSLAGLQLCIAVAAGGVFVGEPVENDGPTVFIEYEGSRSSLQKRVKTMLKRGITLAKARAIPLSIIHRPAYKLDTDIGEKWLTAVCEGKVLCVVGPVSKAASFENENDQNEWSRLAERLQHVVDQTGCTVVLVHHTRKPSQQFGPPKKVDDYFNTARGSNAYMGAVDFALGVQREQESTEGMLFALERDGEAGVYAYDFDVEDLTIRSSDRPVRQPSRVDKVERTYSLIMDTPGITRSHLAAALDVTPDTVKGYVQRLVNEERVIEAGTGSMQRTYWDVARAKEAKLWERAQDTSSPREALVAQQKLDEALAS